ncbi:hypothetical protein K443DRAFT_676326 [Laccaria amethystina LaAM-08-1]|uniref:Uncharacterized protein n=1 Tax=Laccaria amethystina LaAM-08-1 TaxID=1095629 RepID=A0A0C9XQV6_9AGAR|nr:hypothetical protein K443DRAFT_676326 [Laccaria amethystina LaAM-08-1]
MQLKLLNEKGGHEYSCKLKTKKSRRKRSIKVISFIRQYSIVSTRFRTGLNYIHLLMMGEKAEK